MLDVAGRASRKRSARGIGCAADGPRVTDGLRVTDRLRTDTARFARGERGSFPIMTAALAMPLVMTVAVALDTAELYRARANFQSATDASVLVAAKIYADGGSVAEAEKEGKATFKANLANLERSTGEVTFTFPGNCQTGNIVASTDGRHPLWFPGIHGVGSGANDGGASIPIKAAAQCPNTSFEVAMVLDTSGSMNRTPRTGGGGRKIDTLKKAAKELVTDLFEVGKNVPKVNAVQFSIVPFSGMVNVGRGNRSAAWMDGDGESSIHHRDLDWSWDTARRPRRNGSGWRDKDGNALTRFTLFDDLNVEWEGCVQARPYPLFTRDTAPDASDPDTLFVPAFAPDEPDNLNGEAEKEDGAVIASKPWCVDWKDYEYWWFGQTYRIRGCSLWTDGNRNAFNFSADPSYAYENDGTFYINRVYQFKETRTLPPRDTGRQIAGEIDFRNDYIPDGTNMPDDNECRGEIQHEKCAGSQEKQLRRQGFTFKYDGAVPDGKLGKWFGPNYMCSAKPLLPLSTSKQAVLNKINSLQPTGMTNVVAGTAWGWRTLSSGAPFTEGRPATQRDNRKIMIVMTDGQNTYGARDDLNRSEYGGYGYGRHHDGQNTGDAGPGDGFLFDGFDRFANPNHNRGTYTLAMDNHLSKTCENAKAEGITIYTVAFDVADGSSIKPTMEGCASVTAKGSGKHYYDAKSSSELTQAFKDIADSIKMLRLVQ